MPEPGRFGERLLELSGFVQDDAQHESRLTGPPAVVSAIEMRDGPLQVLAAAARIAGPVSPLDAEPVVATAEQGLVAGALRLLDRTLCALLHAPPMPEKALGLREPEVVLPDERGVADALQMRAARFEAGQRLGHATHD